jgi:hypothetical protein
MGPRRVHLHGFTCGMTVNITGLFSSSEVAGIHRNACSTAELCRRPQRQGVTRIFSSEASQSKRRWLGALPNSTKASTVVAEPLSA